MQNQLDDPFNQRKTATIMQMLSAFGDIVFSNDPAIQFFVVFFAIFIGIPFFGGIAILIYERLKDPVKRPRRSFAWLPFIGSTIGYHFSPLDFFNNQESYKIVTIDTLKKELVYVVDKSQLDLVYEKASQPLHYQDMIYMGVKPDYKFKPFEKYLKSWKQGTFFDQMRLEMARVCEQLLEEPEKDLFDLSRKLALGSLLVACIGPKFYAEHGQKFIELFEKVEQDMNHTISQVLKSFSMPSAIKSSSQQLNRFLEKYMEVEPDTYLSTLPQDDPFNASHIAHVILMLYPSMGALAAWTIVHLNQDEDLAEKVDKHLELQGLTYLTADNALPVPGVLDQVFAETVRLHAPMNSLFVAEKPFEVAGYKQLVGTPIGVSPLWYHMTMDIQQPTVFDHTRKVKKTIPLSKLLPFDASGFVERWVKQIGVVALLDVEIETDKIPLHYYEHQGFSTSRVKIDLKKKIE